MSYQVLARKWRPRNFSELAGQEHVQRALVNALDNNRLHHAFLFTGTRGVGKTTIARILAKSLNCEKGVSATPCGQCSACTEINEGRFIDLIEVDAASKTKVEDTRELLENVQYAPTRGRYKVYLIDEVHMLSAHSFNALLKTLEEPPPHVKFLLATTDPQKLPVTILSRCLQFNLKRLPADLITEHLSKILSSEQVNYDDSALALISEAADGSMRDALSLLDQAIAYGNGELKTAEVRNMLGAFDKSMVFDLLNALAEKNAGKLLRCIDTIADFSADFDAALSEVLALLHQVALAQVAPQCINNQLPDSDKILQLASTNSPEDTQLFYQIGLLGRRDLPFAPNPKLGFEMTLLRMLAFYPSAVDATVPPAAKTAQSQPAQKILPASENKNASSNISAPAVPDSNSSQASKNAHLAAISKTLGTASSKKKLNSNPEPSTTLSANINTQQNPPPGKSSATMKTYNLPRDDDDWEQFVENLALSGVTLNLARNCALGNSGSNQLELHIAELHQQFTNKQREKALEEAISNAVGRSVSVVIKIHDGEVLNTPSLREQKRQSEKQKAAEESIYADTNIKTILETFDGKILPKSIEPVD